MDRIIEWVRVLCRWLVRWLYRFECHTPAALETPGPVLLLPNHVSWLDWLFLGIVLDRDWKFVVSRASAETSWLHRKVMLNSRTFPIDTTSPYGVKHMAEFLQRGGRLVLFAEGRISRTGSLMKLFEGTGFLLFKTEAKVVPCYLRGAHRLPFSPNRDRHFCFPRVTLHIGPALTPPHRTDRSHAHARTELTRWVRDQMIRHQFEVETTLGPPTVLEAVVETARKFPGRPVLQDMNRRVNYRGILAGMAALSDVLREALPVDARRVGVLLPNVNATPVSLLALWLIGKEPAILNYSVGPTVMRACAELAGLRTIVTSRAFLTQAKLSIDELTRHGVEFVYLEDLRARLGLADKLGAWWRARFQPGQLVNQFLTADNTAVILFTSGSEGIPKGVELTHANLLANIRQMMSVCDLQDWDRMFNALPIFHSFGLTIGTLAPLVRGCHLFLYPSPLHYRQVPNIFYFSDSTVLLGTNTFLNGYARRAHPYDFRSLRYLFAGAEKVQSVTARTWAETYGVRVLEGYGATECSPCVSVCLATDPQFGSAGRLLPGIEYRLEPVEGVPRGGRLQVRGPNIMKGYLNDEPNRQFLALDGWYDTGDVVDVDEEGFVHVLGRLKRFAKVSGEMISLTAVEEALAGAFPHYHPRAEVAILSRPDAHKGEALVCVTNQPKLELAEVRAVLRERGFSNLCVPREIRCVPEIPKLGTGKVDHRVLAESLDLETRERGRA